MSCNNLVYAIIVRLVKTPFVYGSMHYHPNLTVKMMMMMMMLTANNDNNYVHGWS